MLVAIHQPNFLPWLGYFFKMVKADVFVLLDDVQFIKRGFIQRNSIKTPSGRQWLTVPVLTKGRYYQKIIETRIDNRRSWKKKVIGALRSNYAKARFFGDCFGKIENVLASDYDMLADLNVSLLEVVRSQLGIDTPMCRSSELPGVEGKATERLISICKGVDGTQYLSGFGGANYQEEDLFREAGIELRVSDFAHPEYAQLWGPFEPKLSIVDLLFNVGPDSSDLLLGGCSPRR